MSSGVDGIPTSLVKLTLDDIAKPLTYIINLSFKTGVFPDRLKIAVIKPIFKKGDVTQLENYRPISLLPAFSKVFEYCMCFRIRDFMTDNNIWSQCQHAYLKGRSTQTAIFDYVQAIITSLEQNLIPVGLLIDLTKAYDCIDFGHLLLKLERYGIRGNALRWIRSYVTGRTQIVEITKNGKTHTSDIKPIILGIPQGSVIGPILFNIYINDMSETQSSGNCMMSQYADDSSFLIQAEDLETAIKSVDGVFKNVENWITKEKMIINKSKTNIIFFKTNRSNITLPDRVHISDVNIVPNSSARLLGMIIDENLSWNKHICQLCNRLSSVLYSLKILSRYMTKQMLKIVYHSNFESLVRYGCIFYGNNANMETVLILQKQALRVINNLGFRDSCRGVFKKTGILTIYGIYIQECVLFVFKNREYFATQITDHPYETRNIDYVYPKHRLTLTEKNVYYSCITIYNKLPPHIKKISTLQLFKKTLFKFLLNVEPYTLNEYDSFKE
nr:unnamed protein product [Callosobruchus chinensis]CAH7763594.1 unnamed protein product [Callosobruchus chinensis]